MKKVVLVLIWIGITILPTIAQNEASYSRLKIYFDTQHHLQDLVQLGIACDHGDYRPAAYLIHDFSEKEQLILKQAGFRYEVLITDVIEYYQQQNSASITPKSTNCQPNSPIDYTIPSNFSLGAMGGYLTYQQLLDNLDTMASKYPHLISAKTAIDSNNLTHQGRPIYWVKISDNPLQDEPEPKLFYNALHHAREPMSMMQLVYYMWYLLENYQTDSSIQYIINETQLYFVPCVNPDGYVYNENNTPQGGGLWRKNRRNNGDGTFGVDLNRNYGYAWGQNNQGSSPNTSSDIYRGTQAFSEPETQNIRDFCLTHQFELVLNYHSYGNALVYPWGYQNQLTPDSIPYQQYAAAMTRQNKYVSGINRNILGYSTNGDADDWMYGEQVQKNKIFSFTPEVSSGGFWMPATAIVPTCKELVYQNLTAARLLLNYAEVAAQNEFIVTRQQLPIPYIITRYGQQQGSFTVSVQALSSNIQSTGSPQNYTLNQFEQQQDSITIQLSSTIQNGDVVRYVLLLDNGFYTTIDTIEQVYGSYVNVLQDNGNQMTYWSNQNASTWDTTTADYYTTNACITDSKQGNYLPNQTVTLLLNQSIDLTTAVDAQLSFWAKWDIDEDYDYVQVLAAGDDGVFLPLCGNYTNLGTNYQDANAPLYDGQQSNWVLETIDLKDYLGDSTVQIKFQLVSDPFVEQDGFYFDEFTIQVLDPLITNHTKHKKSNIRLQQSQPNPATTKVFIPFDLEGGDKESPTFLQVIHPLGQVIYSQQIYSGEQGISIDINNWSKGLYYYQIIQNGSQTQTLQLVIY